MVCMGRANRLYIPSRYLLTEDKTVAKRTNSQYIKLVSTEDTGFFYTTKKNPKTATDKIELRKYDPVARKHVIFREAKMK